MKITDFYKALYDVSGKYKKEALEENARSIFDADKGKSKRHAVIRIVLYIAGLIVLAAVFVFVILSNFIK